jgi:flavocytochrome c
MSGYIVVGGGLAGLSAAHTIIEAGHHVTLLERNMFMGGNSTKATSGINGGGSKTQNAMGVPDSKEIFEEDMVRGATGVKKGPCPESYDLAKVVAHTSADAIHWIQNKFGLALDTVSRLGGHTQPRTHRSKAGTTFPGMEITYALMKKFEELSVKDPTKATLTTKARVNKLLKDSSGRVIGCSYEDKDGNTQKVMGKAVIVTTGGYGAGGLFEGSLLYKERPDLTHLPTTNGEHCTGDGISFSQAAGAAAVDLQHVQVHPTGLVHLDDPENRVKFLAAEALRGEGGIILDRDGHRFCNDLGTRDYVTMNMWKHDKAPYRLILNEKSYSNIAWHCKHYCGRRVMRHYKSGKGVADEMGISPEVLQKEFETYNGYAKNKNDPWGKKFFNGVPLDINDQFMCATITPVVHYTMGGLKIDKNCQVLDTSGKTIPGLFSAGEATGGVHGRNRLGGSALLECVALGRVAGTKSLLDAGKPAVKDTTKHILVPPTPSTIPPPEQLAAAAAAKAKEVGTSKDKVATVAPAKGGAYTLEEVAKHKKENDCWVVVNGEVLNVTEFLPDHPGGKMAIMAFAGRDATEEFNMVHEEGIVQKYASNTVIGTLKPSSKL